LGKNKALEIKIKAKNMTSPNTVDRVDSVPAAFILQSTIGVGPRAEKIAVTSARK
jgi:hypothetical protein